MRSLLAVLLTVSVLHAADTYVLCAGVETYDDPRISRLSYAVADARAVAAAFRASGVPPRNVTTFGSDERAAARRPTRINLLNALEQLKQRAQPGSRLVLFFAGHGVQEGTEQYLLTVDTNRGLLTDTALPMRLVTKALDGVQAESVLLLLDACRNDPNAGRGDNDAALSDGLARGLRPVLTPPPAGKPPVVATLLACDVGQRAWEDPTAAHGAFTVALLRGLAGAAAGGDGQVRLKALAEQVQHDVRAWADRQGKQQWPRLLNPDEADMVVCTPPPEPVVSVALVDQPLAAVVALLAEQYGAQIVLGQGANAQARVTGRLDNQPLSAVLRILVAAHGLKVRREQKVYILEAKDAPPPQPAPAGEPTFEGPVITVAQDGSGQYRTIAEAVGAAPDGATVRVAAGTYPTKRTQLRRRIALTGGPGVVLRPDGQAKSEGLFDVAAPGCRFEGLTVNCAGTEAVGFWVTGAPARFESCRFEGGLQLALSVQRPGASATLVKCSFSGIRPWAMQAIFGATAELDDCTFDGNGSQGDDCDQLLVNSGAQATLRRCKFLNGLNHGVRVDSEAEARFEECEFRANAKAGLAVMLDARPIELRNCRFSGNGSTAVALSASHTWFRRDAAGAWQWGWQQPIPYPPLPENCRLSLSGCDLRGSPNGAFDGRLASRLAITGCSFDANDPTVPKQLAAVPPPVETEFPGPVLTVAQDGSGQYRTITEAVAAAPDKARIEIRPGVYREQVKISKSLALVGVGGRDQVVIEWALGDAVSISSPVRVHVQGLTVAYRGTDRHTSALLVKDSETDVSVTDCAGLSSGGAAWGADAGRLRLERVAAQYVCVCYGRLELTGCDGATILLLLGAEGEIADSRLGGVRVGAQCRATVRRCDLRGATDGSAFVVEPSGSLTQSDNQFDPGDVTAIEGGPSPLAGFDGPEIIVAADGSGAYRSIAEALAAAAAGARILVKPGSYAAGFNVARRVAILGTGEPGTVKLEVGEGPRAVGFLAGSSGSLLQGMAIRCRTPASDKGEPAGVFLLTPATIDRCQITADEGMAVSARGTDAQGAVIRRCVLERSRMALGLYDGVSARVEGCVMRDNGATTQSRYPVYQVAAEASRVELRHCRIAVGAHGGLGFVLGATATAEDCLIERNAECGVGASQGSDVQLRRCRITANGRSGVCVSSGDAVRQGLLLEGCDLRGNTQGAFALTQEAKVTHRDCQFDPGDTTVPVP